MHASIWQVFFQKKSTYNEYQRNVTTEYCQEELKVKIIYQYLLFFRIAERVGSSNVDLGKVISPVGQYIRSNPGK